jgi:hypothetical protein
MFTPPHPSYSSKQACTFQSNQNQQAKQQRRQQQQHQQQQSPYHHGIIIMYIDLVGEKG